MERKCGGGEVGSMHARFGVWAGRAGAGGR